MSENKTAASKSKRCTGCKVTCEANSESGVLTAGAVVAASVLLTAGARGAAPVAQLQEPYLLLPEC